MSELLDDQVDTQNENLKNIIPGFMQAFPTSFYVTGDFNFPDIHWIDGGSQLQPNPAYGHKINLLFLDIIVLSNL